MTRERVLEILQAVAGGASTPQDALHQLAWLPIEAVRDGNNAPEYARLDHHRELRVGYPEVVFCTGKTLDQVITICERLAVRDQGFLATRAEENVRAALRA